MKHYYLYLDESKPNADKTIKFLCLAGIIIEKETYENVLVGKVNKLKQDVFEDTSLILHESHLRKATGTYKKMRNKETRTAFWNGLKEIFNDVDFKTLGAAINVDDYKKLYSENYLNDEYFIVMQIVLENFVRFLEINNATGTVYIESTEQVADRRLRNLYHKITANGTLYYNKNIFQDKFVNINFYNKVDNIIGLQIADFIPGQLNRMCNSLPPKEFSLIEEIERKLYDGDCNMANRFGLKIMP